MSDLQDDKGSPEVTQPCPKSWGLGCQGDETVMEVNRIDVAWLAARKHITLEEQEESDLQYSMGTGDARAQ